MINYDVGWHSKAEAKLANLWASSFARQLISKSANAIDELLATDAHLRGGEVGTRSRILYLYPLAVLFAVDENKRRVEVIDVWLNTSSA